MGGFIVRRLIWAVLLALLISFFTFVIFFLIPGRTRTGRGAVTISLAQQYKVTGESMFAQYGHFIWRFVRHGDLGRSFGDNQPVSDKLAQALPVTASLVIGGAVLWLLMAFPIGILSALRPRSLLDRAGMIFVLIGVSAHPVWIGLILSYFLGFKLHVTPIGGYCHFFHPVGTCGGATDWAYHMILPWLTFAFLFTALYARMIRAMVIETLHEDYVRTAQAKGAGQWHVLRSHVVPNAILPVVTMVGMDVGLAFAGALFVESVYDLPGIGGLLYDSLTRLDLPIMMGVFLIVSLAVAFTTLIADVVVHLLDPRTRPSKAFVEREALPLPRGGRLRPKAGLSQTTT